MPLDTDLAGPRPKTLARLELARAIGGGLVSPLRYLAHVPGRRKAMARIRADVEAGAGRVDDEPALQLPEGRPLRIFISAAEASGEIHAASLVKELRARCEALGAPAPEITAIGGARLTALGLSPIADPVARAHMGFDGVLQSLPYYVGVLEAAAANAQSQGPDVFVPIDSPALHVPMARMVRKYGVPVAHLVAPQYWAWAPWRVKAYRRAIDLGLTILPHEPSWYARHGVTTKHVGHPLLDALADAGTPASQPSEREDSNTLALLPGSRAGVIRRNLPWMLEALAPLRARRPDVDVAILQANDEHRALIEPLAAEHGCRIAIGTLHAELARARATFAVSGTILTDALHHQLPGVVIYRVAKRLEMWMSRHVLTCPYFASTNLLAGEEVLPEHCFRGDGPMDEVSAQISRVFDDDDTRKAMFTGLRAAKERLGPPGAIHRTASHVLRLASERAGR